MRIIMLSAEALMITILTIIYNQPPKYLVDKALPTGAASLMTQTVIVHHSIKTVTVYQLIITKVKSPLSFKILILDKRVEILLIFKVLKVLMIKK